MEKFLAAAEKGQSDDHRDERAVNHDDDLHEDRDRRIQAAGQGHIKMAIGGAPVSQMFADEIGADGYGANASAAVDLFLRLAAGG